MGLFDSQRGGRHVGGMSPIQMGVLGLLAYKALKGKGGLAGIFGSGQSPDTAAGPSSGGALPGGALSGGVLGSGLKDLLDRFRQSGHEDKAQSWVSTGSNKPIAPQELEHTLGEERIQWLMEQTGLPREELLAGLSKELPDTVDKLTPDGRVPTDDESSTRLS
ncbi:MAG: YidB family protein [Povalibacter sp.]